MVWRIPCLNHSKPICNHSSSHAKYTYCGYQTRHNSKDLASLREINGLDYQITAIEPDDEVNGLDILTLVTYSDGSVNNSSDNGSDQM